MDSLQAILRTGPIEILILLLLIEFLFELVRSVIRDNFKTYFEN